MISSCYKDCPTVNSQMVMHEIVLSSLGFRRGDRRLFVIMIDINATKKLVGKPASLTMLSPTSNTNSTFRLTSGNSKG